jgi:non-ribosomal peptide synthetase component F
MLSETGFDIYDGTCLTCDTVYLEKLLLEERTKPHMGIMGNRAIWEAESDGLELLNITIGDLVDQQAAALSDKEALVYHYPERGLDVRLTFRELRDEVNRVARGLLALGIVKGEHVAIWAPNVPEWIFLQLALGVRDDPFLSICFENCISRISD